MKAIITSLFASIAAAFLVNCGSDSATPSSTANLNNSVSTAVVAAKTNIAKAQVFAASTSSSLSSRATNPDWTAAHLTDLGGEDCTATTTPLAYMQAMSSSTCTVSPYFDLNNILDLMCVLTNELEVTDGLPDELDSTTITVSADTATACGVADANGASITGVSVATTSVTTNYQRLITFTLNGERKILMGSSGTITNIAFTYNEGSTSAYRGYYTYDSSASVTKFALHSRSTNGGGNGTLFRVLIDESEAPGEVYAVGTRNDDNASYVRWTYQAPLDASDVFGVALVWNGQSSGTAVDTCVDPSDSFVSDGTTSNGCGDGYSAPPSNDFSTLAGTAIPTIIAETLNEFTGNVGETDVISFNDSNIHTSVLID